MTRNELEAQGYSFVKHARARIEVRFRGKFSAFYKKSRRVTPQILEATIADFVVRRLTGKFETMQVSNDGNTWYADSSYPDMWRYKRPWV